MGISDKQPSGRVTAVDIPTGELADDPDANEPARLSALYRYGILDTPPEAAFDGITALAARFCGVDCALISLVDSDRLWFKSHPGWAGEQAPRLHAPCSMAIRTPGEVLLVRDASADGAFIHPMVNGGEMPMFYAGAPLVSPEGWPVGTLCVLGPGPRDLNGDQTHVLTLLASQVVELFELRRARVLLEVQSTTDDLTGTWNRSGFERRLVEEWTRWSRHGGSLSMLAIDVDNFKRFNDAHGHVVGDEALRQLSRAIDGALRGHDVLARMGGEQFGVILPATDLSGAMIAAERVRLAVSRTEWPRQALSVSIGVAVASPSSDPETHFLTDRAQHALNSAKALGRNRVEMCLAP